MFGQTDIVRLNENLKILFVQIAQDDEQAFKELFFQWYKPLYSHALGYVKLEELAGDVVQRVLLRVWERRAILSNVEDPVSWLYTAARFQAFQVLKMEFKQHAYVQNAVRNMKVLAELTPEEKLVRSQTVDVIRGTLNTLTEKQREAYRLSRFEGLTYQQIAVRWQISVPTVKEHIAKAIKAIKEQLAARRDDLIALFLIFFPFFF